MSSGRVSKWATAFSDRFAERAPVKSDLLLADVRTRRNSISSGEQSGYRIGQCQQSSRGAWVPSSGRASRQWHLDWSAQDAWDARSRSTLSAAATEVTPEQSKWTSPPRNYWLTPSCKHQRWNTLQVANVYICINQSALLTRLSPTVQRPLRGQWLRRTISQLNTIYCNVKTAFNRWDLLTFDCLISFVVAVD